MRNSIKQYIRSARAISRIRCRCAAMIWVCVHSRILSRAHYEIMDSCSWGILSAAKSAIMSFGCNWTRSRQLWLGDFVPFSTYYLASHPPKADALRRLFVVLVLYYYYYYLACLVLFLFLFCFFGLFVGQANELNTLCEHTHTPQAVSGKRPSLKWWVNRVSFEFVESRLAKLDVSCYFVFHSIHRHPLRGAEHHNESDEQHFCYYFFFPTFSCVFHVRIESEKLFREKWEKFLLSKIYFTFEVK